MKPLTLDNLQADGACAEGIEWITPLLAAVGPTEADWLQRPLYWSWALDHGYNVPVTPALARSRPLAALRHAKRFPDEVVIELARSYPWAGFQYALARLPDEVVIELRDREAWFAAERMAEAAR